MRDSKLSQSISIIGLGILLSIIALVILGYSEGLYHNLNQVRWLPLTDVDAEDLELSDGMVKITGKVEPMGLLNVEGIDDDLLYYKKVYEEKIDDIWTTVKTEQTILNFRIDDYVVTPSEAVKFFTFDELIVSETETTKETIYSVPAKDRLIVVGAIKGNQIKSGEIFTISNKTNEILEDELRQYIHSDWWILRHIALAFLVFGIIASVLPILNFFEVLSELGPVTILVLIAAAIIISLCIIAFTTLIFAYWYLVYIIIIFIVYLLFRIFCCRKKTKSFKILTD